MTTSQLPISAFYFACRNNDIDSVKSLLETMLPDQIDRLEPNGSTALHVACYYGHYEIVKLLLERGASTSIKNKYNCTPYNEGKTRTIRKLFSCGNVDDKFVGDLNNAFEWIRVGEHIDQEAKAIRKMLKAYSNHDRNNNKRKKILIEMINLGDYKDIDTIKWYFDQANNKNDPIFILKAYTEETEFYQRLNEALAKVYKLNARDRSQYQLLDFLRLICCHPSFDRYEFQGETYRGMKMNADDLKQYQIGAKIMTKSLLSTSKVRHVAETFAAKKEASADGNTIRRACICKYKIRKAHTALDIQELSVFPDEQEVLVIPYSAFQVVKIQDIVNDYGVITEIELRQCKSHIHTYAAIGIGGGILAAALDLAAVLAIDNQNS